MCMCEQNIMEQRFSYSFLKGLLQLFSPPLSFAILYVLKKIAFAIIFCFTCVYLSYHVAVISLLYIGRIDGFVYVQLLNIVVVH